MGRFLSLIFFVIAAVVLVVGVHVGHLSKRFEPTKSGLQKAVSYIYDFQYRFVPRFSQYPGNIALFRKGKWAVPAFTIVVREDPEFEIEIGEKKVCGMVYQQKPGNITIDPVFVRECFSYEDIRYIHAYKRRWKWGLDGFGAWPTHG